MNPAKRGLTHISKIALLGYISDRGDDLIKATEEQFHAEIRNVLSALHEQLDESFKEATAHMEEYVKKSVEKRIIEESIKSPKIAQQSHENE